MDAGSRFDLLILDLTVPEKMGGYDAFKAIQAFDPAVKAIVSSGYSHEPIVLNYKDYGIAGVAPKPYRSIELIGAVERAIARSLEFSNFDQIARSPMSAPERNAGRMRRNVPIAAQDWHALARPAASQPFA